MAREFKRGLRRKAPTVTIVVLGKYPDIFSGFYDNANTYTSGFEKVFVRDGNLIGNPQGWRTVQGPGEFSMAGNANMGWREANPESDILYVGDDVRFKHTLTVEKLSSIAYSDPTIGLLSPKICGGADNILQTEPPMNQDVVYSGRYLALVCTYIKREVINKVGYLDDSVFKGYGAEDADFSKRVVLAGYRLAVTPRVEVTHGLGRKGTETFVRNFEGNYKPIQDQAEKNEGNYFIKWGERLR